MTADDDQFKEEQFKDEPIKTVEPEPLTAEQEGAVIDRLAAKEHRSQILRPLVIAVAVIVVLGLSLQRYFDKDDNFSVLDTVAHEALRLERDDDSSRLAFPSDDLLEISDYLGKALEGQSLGFLSLPPDWQAIGASVYDYQVAKISVIEIENPTSKEKIFLFATPGGLSLLPKAPVSHHKTRNFQTYGNDHFNMLAWDETDMLVIIVGKAKSQTLIRFADMVGKNEIKSH